MPRKNMPSFLFISFGLYMIAWKSIKRYQLFHCIMSINCVIIDILCSLILELESMIVKQLLFVQIEGCRHTIEFKKISGNSTVYTVVGRSKMIPSEQSYHQNGVICVQSSCINNTVIALGPSLIFSSTNIPENHFQWTQLCI